MLALLPVAHSLEASPIGAATARTQLWPVSYLHRLCPRGSRHEAVHPWPGLALVVAGPGDWHLVAIPLVQVCQGLVVAAARPLVA